MLNMFLPSARVSKFPRYFLLRAKMFSVIFENNRRARTGFANVVLRYIRTPASRVLKCPRRRCVCVVLLIILMFPVEKYSTVFFFFFYLPSFSLGARALIFSPSQSLRASCIHEYVIPREEAHPFRRVNYKEISSRFYFVGKEVRTLSTPPLPFPSRDLYVARSRERQWDSLTDS